MPHDILLSFLNIGLIDVGGSDEKFDKLGQAADDLTTGLKKLPSKAVAFSLVALDPDAPADDPIVQETLEALRHRWPTYTNTFSDIPISVVRGILLDALVNAGAEDANVAVTLACLARNMIPFVKVGREQAVWAKVISEVEDKVDERASAEWTTPSLIAVPSIKFEIASGLISGKISRKLVGRDNLREKVTGSFTHQAQGGQNSHYPHQHPQQWASQAGPLLADSIADAIDAVVKTVDFAGVDITGSLKELSDIVSKHIDGALTSFATATAGLERRTNLLWWREALYSPSARVSYRDMTRTAGTAMMALDLHKQVPVYSPASVAAFLREAVRDLNLESVKAVWTVRELVEEARTSSDLAPLREFAEMLAPTLAGRGPLLAVIAQPSGVKIGENDFKRYVGISAESQFTPEDWASWLYRELQALRAVQKRKARKS